MKQTKSGFTIIELMVVFILIAILTALSVQMTGGRMKNKAVASEAIGMLGMIETACRLFAFEHGYSPRQFEDLTDAGLFEEADIEGSFFSAADIAALLGDERIPLGDRSLENGCGTVNGLTICKVDSGEYTVSETYQP